MDGLWIPPHSSNHHKAGQKLLPRSAALHHNSRVDHITAISASNRDSGYLLFRLPQMTWPPWRQPSQAPRDCWKTRFQCHMGRNELQTQKVCIKGRRAEYRFHIKGTPIPMVSKLPIKSLGRFVDADLNNSAQRDQLRKEKHQRSCQYRQGCTHVQIERMVPAVWSVPLPDVASNNLWKSPSLWSRSWKEQISSFTKNGLWSVLAWRVTNEPSGSVVGSSPKHQ